jgi:hypothetical protein
MHNNLASRLDHIAPFHVMELMKMASTLEEQGRHLIHMGIGEPDFTAPQTVIDAAAKAMADGRLQYTSARPACFARSHCDVLLAAIRSDDSGFTHYCDCRSLGCAVAGMCGFG